MKIRFKKILMKNEDNPRIVKLYRRCSFASVENITIIRIYRNICV